MLTCKNVFNIQNVSLQSLFELFLPYFIAESKIYETLCSLEFTVVIQRQTAKQNIRSASTKLRMQAFHPVF